MRQKRHLWAGMDARWARRAWWRRMPGARLKSFTLKSATGSKASTSSPRPAAFPCVRRPTCCSVSCLAGGRAARAGGAVKFEVSTAGSVCSGSGQAQP